MRPWSVLSATYDWSFSTARSATSACFTASSMCRLALVHKAQHHATQLEEDKESARVLAYKTMGTHFPGPQISARPFILGIPGASTHLSGSGKLGEDARGDRIDTTLSRQPLIASTVAPSLRFDAAGDSLASPPPSLTASPRGMADTREADMLLPAAMGIEKEERADGGWLIPRRSCDWWRAIEARSKTLHRIEREGEKAMKGH